MIVRTYFTKFLNFGQMSEGVGGGGTVMPPVLELF
jgi:hypothetical protein